MYQHIQNFKAKLKNFALRLYTKISKPLPNYFIIIITFFLNKLIN